MILTVGPRRSLRRAGDIGLYSVHAVRLLLAGHAAHRQSTYPARTHARGHLMWLRATTKTAKQHDQTERNRFLWVCAGRRTERGRVRDAPLVRVRAGRPATCARDADAQPAQSRFDGVRLFAVHGGDVCECEFCAGSDAVGLVGSNSNVVLVCTDHLERVLGHSVLAEYAVEVLAGIGGTAATTTMQCK